MKKNSLYISLRRFWVAYKLIFKSYSYLNKTGFIKSHQYIEPLDAAGQAIPWMNYAFVELLNERLNTTQRMFEYGAGFSSLYFSKRVAEITSIEYDSTWEEKLKELLKDCANHRLLFSPVGEDYIKAAQETGGNYDLILVDGRERVACFKASIEALSPHGVLILDDSDREEYQTAFSYAQEMGFKNLRISGLKPFSFLREESTFFYREDNCLGL